MTGTGSTGGHPRAIPAVPATPAQPGGQGQAATPATPATPAIPPKKQTGGSQSYAYAYDAAGNRIQETLGSQTAYATYSNLNQLLSDGNDSYRHDAAGNITDRQSAGLGNRRTFWDAENRLVAIEDAANPANRSDFQYDALGRRIGVQDSDNGTVTLDQRLIYCGTALCAKQDKLTGAVTRYYGDGESRDGTGIYYHRDHLGSLRAATDAAGTVKTAYAYDPYGRQTALIGNASDVDFGYTGHLVHHKSGLALAPFRAYDADIGRWLSRDPIGELGGINIYAYVGNNPINRIDPAGLFDLYGFQSRGGGIGWESRFEFDFNPLESYLPNFLPKLAIVKIPKTLLTPLMPKPVGPLNPKKDFLRCAELDKKLKDEYKKRFGDDERLTRDEASDFLSDMANKYPDMSELYPPPGDMLDQAEQNSKDNWFYKMNP